jgi:hypothetical protein
MEAMQAFLEQQTALLQRMDDMQRRHIAMSDAVLERLSVPGAAAAGRSQWE